MEREQIVRDDFPVSRRGWDPDAVRAHLEALAERLPSSDVSLADVAAARVAAVIGAAEATAAEIEAEARAQAEAIVGEARTEAESMLERARSDARGRVDQAQGAVESLVAQAEELRSKVGSLGESLADEVVARVSPPSPEPEPGPAPEPEPEPAEPEPAPEPEPAASAGASTEDLIAQLQGGTPGTDAPGGERSSPDASVDRASVRLVALNLALDGVEREAIGAQIADEFGEVPDLDEILDDVLARTGSG